MNEQDVWKWASKLWEKMNLRRIEVCKYYSKPGYYIEISGNKIEDQHTFHTEAEVRRFLDGLEG